MAVRGQALEAKFHRELRRIAGGAPATIPFCYNPLVGLRFGDQAPALLHAKGLEGFQCGVEAAVELLGAAVGAG